MKILTKKQIDKIKKDSYERGVDDGWHEKQSSFQMQLLQSQTLFIEFIGYLNRELYELEKNTWDKGRVKDMIKTINSRKDLFL